MDSDENFSISTPFKLYLPDGSSVQQSSDPLSSPSTPSNISANINQLYKSRDTLRDFSIKIGAECGNPIRQDVINHCNKVKINWNQVLTYEKIEKMTKNRIQKMIKNKRIKKNWSEEDVTIFIWVVSKYADYKGAYNVQKDLNQQDWQAISLLIPGVEAETCMFKWLGLKKSNLSDNCWSDRQSVLLQKIVKKFGDSDWGIIAQKLYYANTSANKAYRCPKQCRQHWNCYLNPKLKKGPWSKDEDILLLSNVLKNNGQKRWSEIVKDFNGRTQNALKNRYTLIIQKQIKNLGNNSRLSEMDIIKEYLQRIYIDQFVNMENDHQNSKKLKDLNNVINSCVDSAPKKQFRSLRKRNSLKEFSKNYSHCSGQEKAIDAYGIFEVKEEYEFPFCSPEPSLKKYKSSADSTNHKQLLHPQVIPSRKSYRVKKSKSIPVDFSKMEEGYNSCSQYPSVSDNRYPQTYEMLFRSEAPIYEEQQDYENQEMDDLQPQFCEPFHAEIQNKSHFFLSPVKIQAEDDHRISHNLFESFHNINRDHDFHEQQNDHFNDNSFNFHSFEQFFVDGHQFDKQQEQIIDDKDKAKYPNVFETWGSLPPQQPHP